MTTHKKYSCPKFATTIATSLTWENVGFIIPPDQSLTFCSVQNNNKMARYTNKLLFHIYFIFICSLKIMQTTSFNLATVMLDLIKWYFNKYL